MSLVKSLVGRRLSEVEIVLVYKYIFLSKYVKECNTHFRTDTVDTYWKGRTVLLLAASQRIPQWTFHSWQVCVKIQLFGKIFLFLVLAHNKYFFGDKNISGKLCSALQPQHPKWCLASWGPFQSHVILNHPKGSLCLI